MDKDNRSTFELADDSNLGTVQIADDVVAVIVCIAATEVDGVSSIGGNGTDDFLSKVRNKNSSKGVKISIDGSNVTVEISLALDYGFNIPTTCAKVQEKIKNQVENMTGLNVTDVNVRITGVNMKKDK